MLYVSFSNTNQYLRNLLDTTKIQNASNDKQALMRHIFYTCFIYTHKKNEKGEA